MAKYPISGFTKLFESIIHSTVWETDMHVKITWITMLAMADRNGRVCASVPGLAKAAGVSLPQVVEALDVLSSPDEWSRTKTNEGRRIAEIDGGWELLNYCKYREQRDSDQRLIQTRKAVARHRQKVSDVSQCKPRKPMKAQAEAEAEAEAEAIDQERSSEPSKDDDSEPSVLTISTIGKGAKTWPLTAFQVERWADAFPGLDVLAECRKAQVWLEANPAKRKTPRGMPRFLVAWCSRAVDSPRPIGRASHRPAPVPTYASDWFSECGQLHGHACHGQTAHALRLRIDAGRSNM